MIPEKMDANASIANATRNSSDPGLDHFMLLFEDIDQFFSHLNLSNDSDYATFERLFNCSSNSSNSSCFGHPEAPGSRNYWALVLVLFPIFTLFGNVLVILSVYRERTLQSATNYFIVSLALADLLVAVVVMPFAVYVLVSSITVIFITHTLGPVVIEPNTNRKGGALTRTRTLADGRKHNPPADNYTKIRSKTPNLASEIKQTTPPNTIYLFEKIWKKIYNYNLTS
ncbi:hypothetical protein TcasGA2_TC032796 [Tribolium castaneum]|uniref:G-protein coupled receptors family 1 profile domain-containing protein n=1 Tax=Tribolium castaneum TaxID=7070 RepID=A0A139WJF6_TRICA|nr:hypothetical protein TcasGA2_TC032796 [Tribolium castaneum]